MSRRKKKGFDLFASVKKQERKNRRRKRLGLALIGTGTAALVAMASGKKHDHS